jgi:PAS domain-containing protein
MVAHGQYPDFNSPTGSKRGAPRANDGLIRLDEDGDVIFASPNGISAFNRLGIKGELEDRSLAEAATMVMKDSNNIDESLPLVLTGRAAWRCDIESEALTLSLRAIPLKADGRRVGALVLCRDVTELRRQERELITKDATIREIHHRVKNNLQTVLRAARCESHSTKRCAAFRQLRWCTTHCLRGSTKISISTRYSIECYNSPASWQRVTTLRFALLSMENSVSCAARSQHR